MNFTYTSSNIYHIDYIQHLYNEHEEILNTAKKERKRIKFETRKEKYRQARKRYKISLGTPAREAFGRKMTTKSFPLSTQDSSPLIDPQEACAVIKNTVKDYVHNVSMDVGRIR